MASQCTALSISDEKRCAAAATSSNGLLCRFHSKQCHGLYKGYKTRNARLDALSKSTPDFLAKSSLPLANQTFTELGSEVALREIHDYLYLKYMLLDRVIRARKLHHSRFFSLNLDYGHQHYLDNLQNEKFIALRALERVERRTAEVLYKQKQWFEWVRERQDTEEAQREKESKKIKLEAALFKRNIKELEIRMRELRAREDAKNQDEFLDQVYQEKMAQEADTDDEGWDPIDDVIENERGSFLDLIRLFLWQDPVARQLDEEVVDGDPGEGPSLSQNDHIDQVEASETNGTSGSKKQAKSKKKKKAKVATTNATTSGSDAKSKVETKDEMRRRLKEGSKLKHSSGLDVGLLVRGTIENPLEIQNKTFGIPSDEIEGLLKDVSEIKHLLFCRLLLSHASLLPAALRASSVEEFLNDADIPTADLRDLCMKMEQPGLQEIRDACADMMRGDDEDDGDEHVDEDEGDELDKNRNKKMGFFKLEGNLPKSWSSKREKAFQKRQKGRRSRKGEVMGDASGEYVDFGKLDDEGEGRKIRVKVCGRSIYNYPSEKSMTRGGWLQFSIIAKDSSLFDCIELCRTWNEFFELNALAIFHYFPAADWVSWIGDHLKQQLLQLGFIPYFTIANGESLTFQNQTGGRGVGRRSHSAVESRNIMCGHIKRNDAAMRRFIQYLSMRSQDVVVLVRDGKTGNLLVRPPPDECWIMRGKVGVGRASRSEWQTIKEVGPEFHEEMQKHRDWHFGFSEYYDVCVWSLEAGAPFPVVYNAVQQCLFKAYRFHTGADMWNPLAPILKTLTNDKDTHRARDIKIGEDAMSIYREINEECTFFFRDINMKSGEHRSRREEASKQLFYNEADVLEDQVLFPEEDPSKASVPNALQLFERDGPSIDRFIYDLDSDEELSDLERDSARRLAEGDDDSFDPDETDESEDDESDEPSKPEMSKGMLELIDRFVRDIPKKKRDMKEEFDIFIDRERAKMFKDSWHKADLEPGAMEKYIEQNDMIARMGDHKFIGVFDLLDWLGASPFEHPRVSKDMRRAVAMVSLFFPESASFFESEKGAEFKDSALLNHAERAATMPHRRTYESNKCLPKKVWEEWDKLGWQTKSLIEIYPFEWEKATRPIIAHLYKEAVICPAYTDSPRGIALAAPDPRSTSPSTMKLPLDLFIDYRSVLDATDLPQIPDPRISVSALRTAYTKFSRSHPFVRFSILRIWSAPHFYPLMLGYDRRPELSFSDAVGRTWHWKFIPKDMPYSEWSIHRQALMRIEPFKDVLGDRVMVRRDSYLVMGETEEECKRLSAAVVFAVQTRPWRLEVDLWRSWVNVDKAFLDGLGDGVLD